MFQKDKDPFAKKEEKILTFWKKEDIFQKSLKNRIHAKHYSFYDGPPFATGLPHYGHILAGTIKDVVARYQTMKGFYVPRRFGWDCHGLPVENEIEKMHHLSGKQSIENFGIANFNEECRKIVLRYTSQWRSTVERMGRWVDFDQTYRTMDLTFMESVWWVFGELYKKELVYEGFKVMHYSPKLGTPISNFEANLNYREVDDPSLTVKFKVEGEEKTYFLVWTTTPWTLPSNLALAVNPEITYVKIRDYNTGEFYYLSKDRVHAHYKNAADFEELETFSGEKLLGKKYEPILPYFKGHANAFVVLAGDFVTTTDGSGVVHMAPAFGEDDFRVCMNAEIDPVCPMDINCKFTSAVADFQGLFVKEADKEIIRRLKGESKVFLHTTIRHRYPFCWRTDVPLIYRAVSTWFIHVEQIKDLMIANNEKIHWVPAHIKTNRFGKWLENAKDWAISRNRYWGTPIPIWRSQDGDIRVISSIAELEEKTRAKIEDLHRHFIDDLTFEEEGKTFRRIEEVFDCWFESGSMPYAQNHFPFENREETLARFPADFIAEGLDQTRGWFYTLNVLSSALFNQPAFKNVIVNGIVLAEDGHKMSKRLKNYPEPDHVINKYGSDAIRLYLLKSPVVRADDCNFSEAGVEGVLKQLLLPLFNSYVFLATYAEIYEWIPTADEYDLPSKDLDKWILSLLEKLVFEVTEAMDDYQLDRAIEPLVKFIDELTNWYIRRSRRRFWSDENSADRREAFETLYTVLLKLTKLLAPFIPFLAENIYLELKRENSPESVHLCDFPIFDEERRDLALEEEMQWTQTVVSLGRSSRKENQIRLRQPLGHMHIVSSETNILEAIKLQEDLIKEELNVKDVTFSVDEANFVTLLAKPNFRTLGKKVGKYMPKFKQMIEAFTFAEIQKIMKSGAVDIPFEEGVVSLTEEDVMIERKVREGLVASSFGPITVVFDTHITRDLYHEGLARELINKINTMRKAQNFDVQDRIEVVIDGFRDVHDAYMQHKEFIDREILATDVLFSSLPEGEEEWTMDDQKVKIRVMRSM